MFSVTAVPRIAYIALLMLFIASIPLTWLSKHAWRSKRLFLLFALVGLGSFFVLLLMVWSEL